MREVLSRRDQPCSVEGDREEIWSEFRECIEDHIESEINCSLPWRQDGASRRGASSDKDKGHADL